MISQRSLVNYCGCSTQGYVVGVPSCLLLPFLPPCTAAYQIGAHPLPEPSTMALETDLENLLEDVHRCYVAVNNSHLEVYT